MTGKARLQSTVTVVDRSRTCCRGSKTFDRLGSSILVFVFHRHMQLLHSNSDSTTSTCNELADTTRNLSHVYHTSQRQCTPDNKPMSERTVVSGSRYRYVVSSHMRVR